MLNTSEIQRIKAELGFSQLTVGAEPYIGISRFFEQVAIPNLETGGLTTSATAVAAAASPTPVSLTLTSTLSLNVYDRVIVDVDTAQEEATVQSVVGLVLVVSLFKAHGVAGAYPVAVEGGESMVRLYLERCRRIAEQIARWGPRAGVKKADEVEFFGGAGRGGKEPSGFKTLEEMQRYFRSELCTLLFGVGDISSFGNSGGRVAMY